jgi:hypothetical protein
MEGKMNSKGLFSYKTFSIFFTVFVSIGFILFSTPAQSSTQDEADNQQIIGWQKESTITWSIDTSNVEKPQKYRRAARDAFQQWEATGHRFVYVPTGGEISVIVSPKVNPQWGGYGLWSKITPCGENSWRIREGIIVVNLAANMHYRTIWKVISHEIGHALGVPHLDDPTTLMYPIVNLSGGHVTAKDLEYEKNLQRDCPDPENEVFDSMKNHDSQGNSFLLKHREQ